MISISTVLLILALHWFADFVCQTRWMSEHKSKSMRALLAHTGIYTLANTSGWWATGIADNVYPDVIIIGFLNFIFHTATDYFTSRLTARLWSQGKTQLFFTAVGFDQLLHYAQLFGTWYYLYG
jgi:hypothetical protein